MKIGITQLFKIFSTINTTTPLYKSFNITKICIFRYHHYISHFHSCLHSKNIFQTLTIKNMSTLQKIFPLIISLYYSLLYHISPPIFQLLLFITFLLTLPFSSLFSYHFKKLLLSIFLSYASRSPVGGAGGRGKDD